MNAAATGVEFLGLDPDAGSFAHQRHLIARDPPAIEIGDVFSIVEECHLIVA